MFALPLGRPTSSASENPTSRTCKMASVTAWLLGLHRLDTGRHVAWAILCVEARYCSLSLPGVSTLVRRFLTVSDWKAIAEELSLGLNPGPLPVSGPIVKALAQDAASSVVVQYVTAFETHAMPLDLEEALDARLSSEPHTTSTALLN
jgi:hypothetical protein